MILLLIFGSISTVFKLFGMILFSIHIAEKIASTAPAAPNVWPVNPLVELHLVLLKSSVITISSTLSFTGVAVPCKLI